MPKRIVSSIIFIAVIGWTSFVVSANSPIEPVNARFFSATGVGDNFALSGLSAITTKREEKYDEAKDPALRKGTENWEEPQGSYFAIPALIVGVIGLVLFFNRDK